MAKRINLLQIGTRAIVKRNTRSTDQTVQIPNGTEIKVTGASKIVTLGNALSVELPRWVPCIGTKYFRVQSGAEALDELGRSNTVEQVRTAEVEADKLHDVEVTRQDSLEPSPKQRGFKFQKGWRLSPNKDFFNFRFDYRYLDIPRYGDDESFALEYPTDKSIPFTVSGFNVGYYENGLFIPRSDLGPIDRLKLANQRKKLEGHYLVQGPFVDKWTYDKDTDKAEVNERAIFIPREIVEQRFTLWQAHNNRQAA